MKRLSNYMLYTGLIMVFVSMGMGLAYIFSSLQLTPLEKDNLFSLYFAGAAMSIVALGYKLVKDSK